MLTVCCSFGSSVAVVALVVKRFECLRQAMGDVANDIKVAREDYKRSLEHHHQAQQKVAKVQRSLVAAKVFMKTRKDVMRESQRTLKSALSASGLPVWQQKAVIDEINEDWIVG
jgi:hypothetical protein